MLSIRENALLMALFLAEFARGAFLLTFLPLYTTDFLGWEITSAGVAASVHYLTETLVKTFAGWRLDHSGKPVFMSGLLIGLVSLMVFWLYPHPGLLITMSGLLGLGYAPLWIGVMTQVAPIRIQKRASRVGLVFMAWLTGMGSGLTVINFFIPFGYSAAFLVIAVSLLTAFIISALSYPKIQQDGFQKRTAGYSVLSALKSIAKNKSTTRILLPGMFMQTLSASLLLPVLPVFAASRLEVSHQQYGALLLTGGLAAVLSLIPMGRLADKTKTQTLLSLGFLCAAVSLTSLALVGNRENALYMTLLTGVSYAAILPAWNTLLAEAIPPNQQATGWGLFSTIEGLGIAAGPAIGGYLARTFGPLSALLAAACILFAMALFYHLVAVERILKEGTGDAEKNEGRNPESRTQNPE